MTHNRQQQSNTDTDAEASMAQKRLGRTNRILIATTVLFALAFIPTPLLTVIGMMLPSFLHSFSARIVYHVLGRLYLLSAVFNPLVYACFNKQFRYETKKMIAKILRIKEPIPVSVYFSTENTT